MRGEVHERAELTVPLGRRRPSIPFALPAALRVHLNAIVAGRALKPVLVTDITRGRIDVIRGAAPSLSAVAELALDRVTIFRPEASPEQEQAVSRYCEVEIEQRHGERADVQHVARLLARGFRLRPSIESKFARGMQLLYGPDLAESISTVVASDDSLAMAVRRIVDRHLRAVRRHDPGTRLGEDVEALHQQRVAVRRLRALLQVFPLGFPRRTLHGFENELRWIGTSLGTVRDMDVQLHQLERSAAAAPPGHRRGYEGYRRYLTEERHRLRGELLEALDGSRYFGLLAALEHFAASRPRTLRSVDQRDAQEPVATAGRRALKGAFRKLGKLAERVRDAPTPEDLHALRIRAKRLRYLLEFLADITGKAGTRMVRRVIELQDLLGAYHDAVVAADTVRRYVEGPGSTQPPAALLALGTLVSQHLHIAETKRARFDRTWRRFVRRRNTRLWKEVLRRLKDAARKAQRDQQQSQTQPVVESPLAPATPKPVAA